MAFIVGIAGGSCAGKSTIAQSLTHALAPRAVALIAEDDYYHCRTAVPGFDERTYDFDAPAAKDHALLARHLQAARRGEAFDKPLYDFAAHRREAALEVVPPADILVLEGLHAFATDALRAAIDLAIYVEAAEALRIDRRRARDVEARKRTPQSVEAQLARMVLPGHARWVAPQHAHADLVIVNGGAEDAALHARAIAAAVLARLPAGG